MFITLMAGDPAGQWRRALEGLGVVVGRFDPDIRVYTANVSYGALEMIAAADFVLAIEPIGIVKPAHDTAVPAMGADALRRYEGSPGFFSGVGGASVPIGVMDTGLNINHLDISSNRESICGANFAWNSGWFGPGGPLLESEDLWIDEAGHGTHSPEPSPETVTSKRVSPAWPPRCGTSVSPRSWTVLAPGLVTA